MARNQLRTVAVPRRERRDLKERDQQDRIPIIYSKTSPSRIHYALRRRKPYQRRA